MSAMPLARIYAALVEEAEPLRADLFARGYNVEVVFPDAEFAGPADLELRLEHCSPAQAIARVEADTGSPSRCVFLTPSKGPQRDLLLIEMTVAATGTYNRHPLYVPVSLPGATLVSVPRIEQQVEEQTPSLALVLPFPESDVAPSAVTPPSDSGNRVASDDVVKKNDDDWDKLVGAEVTAFLAHAPSVEPARLSLVALGADLQSRVAKQVRSHWEILSLVGVASSVLMLLYVGWHAGPSRPWQRTMEVVHAAPAVVPVVSVAEHPKAPVLAPTPELAVPASRVQPHVARWGDRLIAQDTVREVGRHFKKASTSQPIQAANKGPLSINVASKNKPLTVAAMSAKPVPPARVQTNPTPFKKITDLK